MLMIFPPPLGSQHAGTGTSLALGSPCCKLHCCAWEHRGSAAAASSGRSRMSPGLPEGCNCSQTYLMPYLIVSWRMAQQEALSRASRLGGYSKKELVCTLVFSAVCCMDFNSVLQVAYKIILGQKRALRSSNSIIITLPSLHLFLEPLRCIFNLTFSLFLGGELHLCYRNFFLSELQERPQPYLVTSLLILYLILLPAWTLGLCCRFHVVTVVLHGITGQLCNNHMDKHFTSSVYYDYSN